MLNLDEIYYPLHITIFGYICNILSFINIILCLFILPVIFTKVLKSMNAYKKLTTLYIFAQIFFDIWSLLFKHTILLPLNVIINVGYLQNYTNPVLTNIGFIGFLSLVMVLVDILLCLFIERYYSITKNIFPLNTHLQRLLYLGIAFTNLTLFGSSILSFIVFGHLFSADEALKFINSIISNPKSLLNQQIPCVTDLYTKFSVSTFSTGVTFVIYAITRGFGFSYFTYKNIKCLKFAQTIANATLRRHHSIIIKTLIIQLFMMLIFFGISACVAFFIVTFQQPYPKLYLYIQCNYHIYPILDLIVTVSLIKPYRKTFVKFCLSVFSLIFGNSAPVTPTIAKTSFF